MRAIRTLVLTAVSLLAVTGVAYAGNNSNSITASVSPNKAGEPSGESFHLGFSYAGGGLPDIGYHSDITIQPGKLNLSQFPKCTLPLDQLAASPAGCSKALIGSGAATAYVVPCGTHPSPSTPGVPRVDLDIAIYNGGDKLLSRLQGKGTFSSITGTFVVNITRSPSGNTFSFDLADGLLSPATGTCSPIVTSDFKINKITKKVKKGKGKKKKTTTVGLIENGPCPKSKKWTFSLSTKYTDGKKGADAKLTRTTTDSASSSTTVACQPAKKKKGKKK
jgi:hypothetical protein